MSPLGKLPVKISSNTYKDDIHSQVDGIPLSWRTCIGLSIIPHSYPALITELFEDQVKAMEGESFHIEFTEEAKPFCVKTPQRKFKNRTQETLETQGIIITPVTHPTEWPIVVTPNKGSDSIQMCVDLSHLNCYMKCERYHSATPAQAVYKDGCQKGVSSVGKVLQ